MEDTGHRLILASGARRRRRNAQIDDQRRAGVREGVSIEEKPRRPRVPGLYFSDISALAAAAEWRPRRNGRPEITAGTAAWRSPT